MLASSDADQEVRVSFMTAAYGWRLVARAGDAMPQEPIDRKDY